MKYYQILYAGWPLTVDDDPIFADYSQMFKFRNRESKSANSFDTTPPSHASALTNQSQQFWGLHRRLRKSDHFEEI